MSNKEPYFNTDNANLARSSSQINSNFATSFVNSIVSSFKDVYNWLEANRLLKSRNPKKEIRIITNNEKEPRKYKRIKIMRFH